MQRAGLDQVEVGDQCAHLRQVLGTPNQILIGRVVLMNDGRGAVTGVIDEHIDEIPALHRRHSRRAFWRTLSLVLGCLAFGGRLLRTDERLCRLRSRRAAPR